MIKSIVRIAIALVTAILALITPWIAFAQTPGERLVRGGVAVGFFGGLFAIIWFLFAAVSVALFIFWIVMLVDAITKEYEDKTIWIVILIASFFIGLYWLAAILYYFMVKRKHKQVSPVSTAASAAQTQPSTPEKK